MGNPLVVMGEPRVIVHGASSLLDYYQYIQGRIKSQLT